MIEISVNAIFSRAWELSKKCWLELILLIIMTIFASSIVSWLCAPFTINEFIDTISSNNQMRINELANRSSNMGSNILTTFFSAIIEIGMISIAISICRGLSYSIGKAFSHELKVYIKFVVAEFLCGIIVAIGFFCCIIPGLYLKARLSLVPYLIVDVPELGFFEAFSHSWDKTRDNAFNILLVILCEILIAFVGLLCCCVGVLYAAVITKLMDALVYETLVGDKERNESTTYEYTYNQTAY